MHQQFRRHRYPTEFPVDLLIPAGKVRAQVVDVNETGVRLERISGVRRGDQITLLVNTDRVTGVVRWVGDNHIGVSFVPLAPPRIVDALRYAKRPMQKTRWSSVGLQEMH